MSEVSIKFSCECGKAYKVSERFAGKRVRCKQCGETVTVPSSSTDGLTSTRASAISPSSVLKTGAFDKVDVVPSSDENPVPPPPKKEKEKEKDREKEKDARPKTRPGGDTQIFAVPELTAEMKDSFHRKREEAGSRKGEARLVLFENRKPTKTFRLEKTGQILGRDPKCDIHVENPTISKEHVKIEYTMGMYVASDASSANGLIVNGKKVRRASLKDNDVLQLGDIVFRIDVNR